MKSGIISGSDKKKTEGHDFFSIFFTSLVKNLRHQMKCLYMHCAYFEPLAETQVSTIHLIVKYSKSDFFYFFFRNSSLCLLYADGLWFKI